MEALELHTGEPTVHRKDNTSCVSGVEAKIVTLILKHIDITICFQKKSIKWYFCYPI